MTMQLLSANQAVGEAVRLAGVDVVSAYPITPQTSIIEHIAELISRGSLDADYITVESEHSAMAACIGASVAGARVFTASSSNGLALMHEMLHWAAAQRTPIVMGNVNRALGPPWNIWSDQSDSMSQRDTGWLQIYSETNQEALDATLIAYRVAEDPRVQMPAMVMEDAFLLSHTYMPVDVPEQEQIDRFLPTYKTTERVEPGTMQVFGSFSMPNYAFMELRHDMKESMENAHQVWNEAAKEYSELVGRPILGFIEEYRTEDAEAVIITSGSIAATTRDAVDKMREEGKNVGLVRLIVFRPFPRQEIRAIAERFPVIGVVDRSYSFGAGGPIGIEVRAALAGMQDPPKVGSFVAGLGGRDVGPHDIEALFHRLLDGDAPEDGWIGVKEVVA